MMQKKCTKCLVEKNISEFYSTKQYNIGLKHL